MRGRKLGTGKVKVKSQKKRKRIFKLSADSHASDCPSGHTHTAAEEEAHARHRSLFDACVSGHTDLVLALLSQGRNPNIKDLSCSYRPLHYAARNGHLPCVRALLRAGALVDARTEGGATALHRAAYVGHEEVVRVLLEAGADPMAVDEDGVTPIGKAAGNERVAAILREWAERRNNDRSKG
jgi:ankyrin repeat protein